MKKVVKETCVVEKTVYICDRCGEEFEYHSQCDLCERDICPKCVGKKNYMGTLFCMDCSPYGETYLQNIKNETDIYDKEYHRLYNLIDETEAKKEEKLKQIQEFWKEKALSKGDINDDEK